MVPIVPIFLALIAGRVAVADTKFNGLCYAGWKSQGFDSYDSTASDASIGLAAGSGINTLAIVQTWYHWRIASIQGPSLPFMSRCSRVSIPQLW